MLHVSKSAFSNITQINNVLAQNAVLNRYV